MATCGEVLVTLLENYGVGLVFGIPGVHTVELYRGLAASGVRHITPRHEQGAGFMADGYARVTGNPGVCFIITGPGMTNIATAMAQAYADSIPMLVISSVNARHQLASGNGHLHELTSQRALTANYTAFSHTLMTPDELPQVLARAFAVFESGRPRPVHIEIPLDVITAPAGHLPLKRAAVQARPAPCEAAIASAAARLLSARRPVILAGGGAVDAGAALRRLAEQLQAPVALTINAKGLLPSDHPLMLGSSQSTPATRALVREADVVLAIGTELGETDYDVVFDGGFAIPGDLIRIDIDAEQLTRNFPPTVAIVADARRALSALTEALESGSQFKPGTDTRSGTHAIAEACGADGLSPDLQDAASRARSEAAPMWGAARAAAVRQQVRDAYDAPLRAQQRLLAIAAQALPGMIVAGDSTQPVYGGNLVFEADAPRSWFNSSTGFGTLGYGLPAAIGAKLGAGSRPVVCLIGDGGLQFTLPELASAVEARVPIIVLLWNNSGYGEIKKYMEQRDITPVGVDIYTPDFMTLARGFGCAGARIATAGGLREELLVALTRKVPTVLEIDEASWNAAQGAAC